MGAIRGQFGGLNTDLPFGKVPSGTAREALNVTVRNGQLQKRFGFSEYEDAINSTSPILNVFCVTFADGDVYLVAKLNVSSVGKLYTTQIYNATTKAATDISWSEIDIATSVITLSATEPGWGFLWRDRFHYFDGSTYGVRWNPDVNTAKAYRAGIKAGATATIAAAGAGSGVGGKVGNYHAHLAYRNSATQEEGTVSAPCQAASTGFCTTRPSESTGGIAVASETLPTDYEITGRHAYCTMGNTESLEDGGEPAECFSYRAYPDTTQDNGSAMGLHKADHVLDKQHPFTNAGGLPPAAKCGAWTGQQAVYGGLSVGGKIMFSIPNFPTSVPQIVSYSATEVTGTTDLKALWPKPWIGEAFFDGMAVAIRSAGGLVALYTPNSTYQIRSGATGKLFPAKAHGSFGCVSPLAACAAGGEIHALANGAWTIARMDGIGNLAHERFATTLAEIPAGYQYLASMAYYGFQDQVWAAVVKTGATVAQRILVWDRARQALTAFDPACLGATEGIAAMCEVSIPSEAPFMLLATSTGRLLKYPDGTDDDGTDFAANWVGVFAVERSQFPQKLAAVEVQTGGYCSDNVTWGVRVKRASGDTLTQKGGIVSKSNGLVRQQYVVDHIDGRMIEIELSSTAACTAQWTVHDVVIKTERTDLK